MYRTFTRTWWRENPKWPNGLEPHASKKQYRGLPYRTENEAREACREFNKRNKPGRYSLKMEYEKIDWHR